MSKSYFKGTNYVIIPFNKVTSTIEDSTSMFKLQVFTGNSSSYITLGYKDAPRFLEEYTAWLDSKEQSLI